MGEEKDGRRKRQEKKRWGKKEERKEEGEEKKEKRNWASAEFPAGTNLSQTCHIATSFSACCGSSTAFASACTNCSTESDTLFCDTPKKKKKKPKNSTLNKNSLLKPLLKCEDMGTLRGADCRPALGAGPQEEHTTAAWPCPLPLLAEARACGRAGVLLTPHQRVW